MRRLITLISAGRNRIVMIRRELPRTRDAGWVKSPYRIKRWRVLLSVRPGPATCTVVSVLDSSSSSFFIFLSDLLLGFDFGLRPHRNGPNETQHLTPHRS